MRILSFYDSNLYVTYGAHITMKSTRVRSKIVTTMGFRIFASEQRSSILVKIITVLGLISTVSAASRHAISSSLAEIARLHRGGESTAESLELMEYSVMSTKGTATENIHVVFSDLDGTLIHYPEDPEKLIGAEKGRGLIMLPPSSTGLVGVISSRTLQICHQIRRNKVKLVLVSGMRLATLIKRLPYLPKADAYCCEAGGRIFYPSSKVDQHGFRVEPVQFDGALPVDVAPFYLAEDLEWRRRMESKDSAGIHGYVGNEPYKDDSVNAIPCTDREGLLWEHARALISLGFVPDTKGYSTCFRVNEKHQPKHVDFANLIKGSIRTPDGLATSTNLGCIDYYPASSGKKNWYALY
jgi:hypothetical protein